MPSRFAQVSPGAAATEELVRVLAERDAKRRQDFLDSLTLKRANRDDELQRESLKSLQDQRASVNEQRDQTMATGVAGLLKPHQKIDEATDSTLTKGNLGILVQRKQDPLHEALGPGVQDTMAPNGQLGSQQAAPVVTDREFAGTPAQNKQIEDQQRLQGLGEALKGVTSRQEATRIAIEHGVPPAQVDDVVNGFIGKAPVLPDSAKEMEYRNGLTPEQRAEYDKYQTEDANRKKPTINIGGLSGMYNATNPKDIAEGIRAGEMPPDIQQYGRPVQGAIATELRKKDPVTGKSFDLASAQRIWNAQKRMSTTMNGDRQVRLEQSFDSGLSMLDEIDRLSSQWAGLGLGILSRANLESAVQGLYGVKAQTAAVQLNGQIGQLTSDIATIEQGGLTPTEESRKVADKSMQSWWGDSTIQSMTEQARRNIRIRQNAHNSVAANPVAPGNTQDQGGLPPRLPLDGSGGSGQPGSSGSTETPEQRAARLRKAAGL